MTFFLPTQVTAITGQKLGFQAALVTAIPWVFALAGVAFFPGLAIAGLSLAAMGFVAMQPIFWALPTEYMTGFAVAAGIGLINSFGNLGGFLAPNMRGYVQDAFGGNTGLYSLAVGAIVGAILFASTAFFTKANEVEAGHLDVVDIPDSFDDVIVATR